MNMNAFYDPQLPQSSLAQADPQRSIPVNAPLAYRTGFEPMQTQSSHYSTWSQVNLSDYNSSQPQSVEFQQIYDVNQDPFPHPYSHTNCAATFISTSGPQTGSLPNLGSSYLRPGMELKSYNSSYNSYVTNSTNSIDEERASNGGPSRTKKRRQFSPEDREKIKMVRTLGSCARCRKMKLKVIFPLLLLPRQVCLRYSSAMEKHPAASAERYSAKLGHTTSRAAMIIYATLSWPVKASEPPSLLWKGLTEMIGNSEFDQETMFFRKYHWKFKTETKALQLKWTLPNGYSYNLPEIVVECQEYIPGHGDVVAAKWQVDGRVRSILLPTFACKDQKRLLEAVGEFLDAGRASVEADMMGQITDELERLTLSEAQRVAERGESDMILLALRIRANTILSAGWGTPIGDETLDIPEIVNPSAGHIGERPLPPAIDHQIDVAIWEFIRKDQQSLIKMLSDKLYYKSGRQPWLEIFLTFFISLANVQYVHGQALEWKKCQQQTVR